MKDNNFFLSNKNNISLPFAISESFAISIAKNILLKQIIENNIYEFHLSIDYGFLKASNIIEINDIENQKKEKFFILRISFFKNYLKIISHKYDDNLYNLNSFSMYFYSNNLNIGFIDQIRKISKTSIRPVHFPSKTYSNYGIIYFFLFRSESDFYWSGATIFRNNNLYIAQARSEGIFGEVILIKTHSKITHLLIDNYTEIYVSLFSKNMELESAISHDEFFGLKNLAKIGGEIICFQKAEMIQNGLYKITKLIRGLYGTETFITEEKNNSSFYLFDNNLENDELTKSMLNIDLSYRAVSFGNTINDSNEEIKIICDDKYALNYSVCNFKINIIDITKKKIQIKFNKRIRNSSDILFDENNDFNDIKFVVFRSMIDNEIKKIYTNNNDIFLIRIFEDENLTKIIDEFNIKDLNFEIEPKANLDFIYVQIAHLNSDFINNYSSILSVDLILYEIKNIKFLKSN